MDNGPQFSGETMSNFCESLGITHIFSPMYHPNSNGEVEVCVKTFKKVMKCSSGDPFWDLQNFLFNHRNTPHSKTNQSPSELFLGRKVRTILSQCNPRLDDFKCPISMSISKNVKIFQPGEPVWIRGYAGKPKWVPGRVLRGKGEVKYVVQVDSKVTTRHLDQMKPRLRSEDSEDGEAMFFQDPNQPSESEAALRGNIEDPQQPQPPTPRRYPARERRPPRYYCAENSCRP